jgi:5'-nucleotidase / UDP-sugar diphosphatase
MFRALRTLSFIGSRISTLKGNFAFLPAFAFTLAISLSALPVMASSGNIPQAGEGPWNLTVFHTNDSHSHFFPRPAVWRNDGKMVGGIIPLAHHLTKERSSASASILVDAGDFMTGNPICEFEEDGVRGAAIAKMMSLMEYDAGVIGNHEFDIGRDDLAKLVNCFQYPLLAADIVDDRGRPVFRRQPVIIERGGLRIGIMGTSTSEMEEVVAPTRFSGLHMAPQAPLLRAQLQELLPVTDVQILLSHNGHEGDLLLAEELAGSGLDVIVGGHSHRRFKKPLMAGGILIVQAGSKMTNLGRLDLWVEDGRVVRYNGQLVDLWAAGATAHPELEAVVSDTTMQVNNLYGSVIGTLETDWRKSRSESNLGNWLCDVIREKGKADVAFFNTGGIRSSVKAGPITALNLHEVLPFANLLVTTQISGVQLRAIIQQNADASISKEHGILQVSGITYSFRKAPDGECAILAEALVGGKPIVDTNHYTMAIPDYVAMMADVYLNIDVPPVVDEGMTLTDVAIEAIKKAGTVSSSVEGRIQQLDQAKD